jgi:hypothetical protein
VFASTSRYYNIQDAVLETKDSGNKITYKRRRFLPDLSTMIILQEISVSEGDRLDRISARIVGDPEQFWRICDANNIMHPLELTNEPGSSIIIARPWS